MPGMSVTPAVLSQTLCQRLFSRLTERYWQHWASVLMQRTDMVWTEYTLYYLIAEHAGLIEKFHVTLPAVRDYFAPVMYGGKLISNVGTLIFAFDPTAPGFFTIMQSNTKIPAREVRRQLMNYLPLHI